MNDGAAAPSGGAARTNWRRMAFAVCLLLGVGVLVTRLTQGEKLLAHLRSAHPVWIAVALALQIAFTVDQAAFWSGVFRLLGIRQSIKSLVLPVVTSGFIGVVAPGGALAGVLVVVDRVARQGVAMNRALMAAFLYFLIDYTAFLLVLFVGVLYLFVHHDLKVYEIIAAGLLLALTLTQAAFLIFAHRKPKTLERIIVRLCLWLSRVVRCVTRRKLSLEEKAVAHVRHTVEALEMLRRARRDAWRVVIPALLIEVLSIAELEAVFLAFRAPVPFGVLIAGYGIGMLFMIVSITPQGLGAMEGAMTAALASLGVPLETAVVVTLVYRGLTFWLPLMAGFFGARRMMREG